MLALAAPGAYWDIWDIAGAVGNLVSIARCTHMAPVLRRSARLLKAWHALLLSCRCIAGVALAAADHQRLVSTFIELGLA
jgi:hypothetical protein